MGCQSCKHPCVGTGMRVVNTCCYTLFGTSNSVCGCVVALWQLVGSGCHAGGSFYQSMIKGKDVRRGLRSHLILTPLCAVPPALQSHQVWHSESLAGGTAVWTVRNRASVTQHRHISSSSHTLRPPPMRHRDAPAHTAALLRALHGTGVLCSNRLYTCSHKLPRQPCAVTVRTSPLTPLQGSRIKLRES